MASFTDKLVEFNPYIAEVPVDDYVRVGLYKQQQYEAGVQKVQGFIDNVRGMEVVKDVHKDYLDQTLAQLQKTVSKTVSSDFSNNQIVNQIGTLTSKIERDPILQNAIISTANYKKGIADMQKARAEGKSNVVNEDHYLTQAQSWLSDRDSQSTFNGQYIPYRDVRKKMFDILKDVGVDTNLTQIPFKRNADGTVMLDSNGNVQIDTVMLETTTEGKSAQKIRQAIQLGLDEGDIQQLTMEGQYHFKGLDAQGMKQVVDRNYQARLDEYNHVLSDLNVQKMTNTKDVNFQNSINEQIANYKGASENMIREYKTDMENLNANPEAYKGNFYSRNYLEQVGNAFSTSKKSFKYLDNPYQKQVNEDREFDLKYKAFIEKGIIDRARLDIDRDKADKTADKEAKESAGLISAPLLGGDPTENVITTEDYKNQIASKEAYLAASKATILENAFHEIPLADRESKLYQLKEAYDKGAKDSVDHRVAEYFRLTDDVNRDIKNKKHALMTIESQVTPLNALTRGLTGMTIKQPIGSLIYTPETLAEFNDKWNQVVPDDNITIGTVTTTRYKKIDKELAKKIFSPSEEILYNARSKQFNGEKLTEDEKMIIGKLDSINKSVNIPNSGLIKQRNKEINDKITTITKDFQPERYTIDAGNGQKQYQAKGIVTRLLQKAKERGESLGSSPHFDYDEAVESASKEGAVYGVYKKGDQAFITLDAGKNPTQYLPISVQELGNTFPGAFDRPFDPIQNTLALTGGRTTNVQGKGQETAYFQKHHFPNIKKYGVKADIEQGLGGFQLKLHIYDPRIKSWTTQTPFYGSEAQLLEKIKTIGDLTVEQLLQLTPEQLEKLNKENAVIR